MTAEMTAEKMETKWVGWMAVCLVEYLAVKMAEY